MSPHPLARRRSAAKEDGFALPMALAVMSFVSLVVVALLSLVLATILANRNMGTANRLTRAADAALESAVDNIRMDPTGSLGTRLVADPTHCSAGPSSYTFANGTRPADAVTVGVTCSVDTNFAATRVPAPGYSAKQGSLLVVGDSYNGAVKWKTDCPTSGADSLGPNCFPWTSALGIAHYAQATSAISAYPATLVHSGPAALSFASNLVVRKGTVAVRNVVQGSPSILVGGTYGQGSPGLMASSVTCGLLAKEHAWSVAATRLADLSNSKVCDDPTAKALTADDGLNAPTEPWTPTVIRNLTKTAPASCAGSTVAIDPGAYNQVETARLNALFDGTCASKTFWFKPGDYWFDVGGSDSALSIKDATSNFIFGAMATPSSTVCDSTQSGVSITLSARSSIRHTGGNVSVCPKLSGTTASTAIYQNGQADNGWIANATAMTATASGTQVNLSGVRSPSTATVTNPSSALVTDSNSAGASFTCDEPSKALIASDFLGALAAGHNCGGSAAMTFTGWGDTGGPAPSSIPITSAQVVVTGAARHANADFPGTSDWSSPDLIPSQTVIDVTPQGSTRTCSVTYPQINRSGAVNSVSYELLDDAHTTPGRPGQPSCSSLLTDRISLYKANIVVTQYVNADCPIVILDPVTGAVRFLSGPNLDSIYATYDCGGSYGFTIDSAQVRTSSVVQSTAFTTTDYDSSNPGYWFSGYLTCPLTGGCPAVAKNITVKNFENSTAPYVPTGSKVASATALITGSSNNANGSGSKVDLTLTIPGYAGCSTSASGLPGARLGRGWGDVSQTDSIDLFASPSTCGALLSTVDAALLSTASLKVTTTLACESLCVPTREYDFILNRVQISTTSVDPYNRPVSASLFTEKSATTRFVVAGGISMPRATLDLAWRGTAPDPATTPILGGRSVVGALGSDMSPTATMGVVCCTPSVAADRLVRLDARVNGKVRASAVVHFVDTSSGASMPGKLIEVRDWHYCTDQQCSNG